MSITQSSEIGKDCIMGYDVAAIMGMDASKTPRDLWLEKKGLKTCLHT